MDLKTFFDLSLATQVALGSGFLAYAIAYAGWRENHTSVDTVFITIAFAAMASLGFKAGAPHGAWASSALALLAAVVSAALWRGWGRSWCLKLMSGIGIHREDGVHKAWASVVQAPESVDQASVYLKSGTTLHLLNRREYLSAPWQGLYLGGDGSVVMIVEEEDTPEGKEKKRTDILHDWGTRMTYIPAGEIARVELRMKGR